jgi:hypothetical protein
MTPAISTKAALNRLPGATAAAAQPTATPATAGNAQDRNTSGITSPRARCAR